MTVYELIQELARFDADVEVEVNVNIDQKCITGKLDVDTDNLKTGDDADVIANLEETADDFEVRSVSIYRGRTKRECCEIKATLS